jgi:protein associated with RNAse G/E
LDYVDLDIDILVWKDFSYQILDSDEFLENAKRFSYSDEMRKKVRAARDELISLIETRTFPFDYKFCT